jgi:hypothetical protein
VILTSVNLSEAPDENRIEGSAVTDLAATRLAQENLPPDAVILANGYASFSHWLSHWLSLRCLVPFAEDQLDCAHRT